jgi:hypothetical protein
MNIEYQIIKDIYGDKTATRSKVPYINHIDEGLYVLDYINASGTAKRAFCLHPLLQVNEFAVELLKHTWFRHIDRRSIVTASMYANSANMYLCRPHTDKYNKGDIQKATGLVERNDVMDMLLADKVQNYKDFEIYHKGTHPRSGQLDNYFLSWLDYLAPFYGYTSAKEIYKDMLKVIHDNLN